MANSIENRVPLLDHKLVEFLFTVPPNFKIKGFNNVKGLSKKIMVTHVHPSETVMEKFTEFFPGSKGIKRAVEKFKPDFLLCSHVHEAEGIEEKIGKTRVINVGKKGKILEL